jgi:hypothetical protein
MQKVVESYVHCMYCFIVRITLLMLKVSNTSAHDDLMSYICSHGHKNIVQCVKWNQNGNWVLTASKDQIIKVNIFLLVYPVLFIHSFCKVFCLHCLVFSSIWHACASEVYHGNGGVHTQCWCKILMSLGRIIRKKNSYSAWLLPPFHFIDVLGFK